MPQSVFNNFADAESASVPCKFEGTTSSYDGNGILRNLIYVSGFIDTTIAWMSQNGKEMGTKRGATILEIGFFVLDIPIAARDRQTCRRRI